VSTVPCRSCHAPVRHVVMATSGKTMPIDVEPVSDGNVVVDEAGAARVLGKDEAHDGPRFKSHFASCPQAGAWRRKK